MNRVWKKFLKNLAWSAGIAVYVCGAIALSFYVEKNMSESAGALVGLMFATLPMLGYVIHNMWLDAKRKVDWENREMLSIIKGD